MLNNKIPQKSIIKSLIIMASILLILQSNPIIAHANADGPYTYTLSSENKATITGYSGGGGAITIPDKFIDGENEYPVVAIGTQAFINNSALTSVVIPEGVTTIGDYAFHGCAGLTSVTLPDSLTSIGHYSFAFDYQLANVTIPTNVNKIGEAAFGCCFKLTAIHVNSANTEYSFNDGVLYDHSMRLIVYPSGKLDSSFTIPDGVTSIYDGAFFGNSHLSTVTFPSSVGSIGNTAFLNCSNLQDISLPNSVTSIGQMVFENCSKLSHVTLPNKITYIGVHAFNNCTLLDNIIIPDTVTSIGWGAFSKCKQLSSITIPNGISAIEDLTFSGCTNLTNITIPSSISSIGNEAFKACTNLTSAKFTGNAPKIGSNVFENCSTDFKVYYPNDASTGYASYGYTTVPCYKIYYDGNGNSGGMVPTDNHIYLPGENFTAIGNTGNLVKRGFVFEGWNTQADGGGHHYTAGDFLTMGNSETRLFAQWVGHAPTDIILSSNSVNENQPSNTSVGIFSADDTDYSDSCTYELISGYGDNHDFSIDNNILKTKAPLDYKTKKSYNIRVKATDLANLSFEKAFTITVNKVAPSSIADLSNITLSAGNLSPAYAANITNYSASVDYGVSQITVNTTPSNPYASISGFTINNGVYSKNVSLEVGSNLIPIVVTAQDGVTMKTYTINMVRSNGSSGGGSKASVSPSSDHEATMTVSGQSFSTVSYNDIAKAEIPEGAVTETTQIRISKVSGFVPLPSDKKLISTIFEFTKNTKGIFKKPIIIALKYDNSLIGKDQIPVICYFDEEQKTWVNLGGTADGKFISSAVDHFTKFAVFSDTVTPKTSTVGSQVKSFADIENHWAKQSIEVLLDKNIISGYPNGSFKPNSCITRAEFVSIIVRGFHLEQKNDGKAFKDMANHWASTIVSTANANGIINGYEDNCFRPDEPITREQMAVMIVKAAKLNADSSAKKLSDDSEISLWAKESINIAVKNNIVLGYPDGSFYPHGNATRAEAVTVICKALQAKSY